jgi:hypothetical protein
MYGQEPEPRDPQTQTAFASGAIDVAAAEFKRHGVKYLQMIYMFRRKTL